eukprot:GHUV01015113.1.p1 GENE.GHUV01015113.1~~GHUV01015113.1.p1  ORF type:complete len:124 (+),score=24.26 GHUV01015113.1:1242-1613(+)
MCAVCVVHCECQAVSKAVVHMCLQNSMTGDQLEKPAQLFRRRFCADLASTSVAKTDACMWPPFLSATHFQDVATVGTSPNGRALSKMCFENDVARERHECQLPFKLNCNCTVVQDLIEHCRAC